jgi:hypothetical protein
MTTHRRSEAQKRARLCAFESSAGGLAWGGWKFGGLCMERLDRWILEEGDRSGLVPLPAEVDERMSHLRRVGIGDGRSLVSRC